MYKAFKLPKEAVVVWNYQKANNPNTAIGCPHCTTNVKIQTGAFAGRDIPRRHFRVCGVMPKGKPGSLLDLSDGAATSSLAGNFRSVRVRVSSGTRSGEVHFTFHRVLRDPNYASESPVEIEVAGASGTVEREPKRSRYLCHRCGMLAVDFRTCHVHLTTTCKNRTPSKATKRESKKAISLIRMHVPDFEPVPAEKDFLLSSDART